MKQKKYPAIRLFFLGIMTSAVFGLNVKAQDTIVLKASEFDQLANELMTEQKLSQNFRNGFDSLRVWYNDLSKKYERSQSNLASCMNERDIAHAYIDTLRTNLSRAWTAKDIAEAKAQAERNKNKKAWGVGFSGGYNPFTRLPYAGIGINFSIIRFSLRGLFKESGGASVPTTSGTMIDRMRSGY